MKCTHYQKESDGVFTSLMMFFKGRGLNVFNQKRDLAGHDVSLELMQKHAAGSQLVLALLSPDYFTSKFCRGELEGAKEAGVPIVPVVFRNVLDAFPKDAAVVRPATIEAVVLPPIDTSSWTEEGLDEEIARVRGLFLDVLHQEA